MQHLTVDLVQDGPGMQDKGMTFKLHPTVRYKAMLNVASLTTKLPLEDYFPLNHLFFLEKPIHPMYQMGIQQRDFDK